MLECLGKALQGRSYLTCALDEAKSLGLWKGEEENPRQDKQQENRKGCEWGLTRYMSLGSNCAGVSCSSARSPSEAWVALVIPHTLSFQGCWCREQLGRKKQHLLLGQKTGQLTLHCYKLNVSLQGKDHEGFCPLKKIQVPRALGSSPVMQLTVWTGSLSPLHHLVQGGAWGMGSISINLAVIAGE